DAGDLAGATDVLDRTAAARVVRGADSGGTGDTGGSSAAVGPGNSGAAAASRGTSRRFAAVVFTATLVVHRSTGAGAVDLQHRGGSATERRVGCSSAGAGVERSSAAA